MNDQKKGALVMSLLLFPFFVEQEIESTARFPGFVISVLDVGHVLMENTLVFLVQYCSVALLPLLCYPAFPHRLSFH